MGNIKGVGSVIIVMTSYMPFKYRKRETMNTQAELDKDTIAISKISYSGSETNYLVLRKQRMLDNTYTYKVQWYNKKTKYFWSNYDMTLDEALDLFYAKIKSYITEINQLTKREDLQT